MPAAALTPETLIPAIGLTAATLGVLTSIPQVASLVRNPGAEGLSPASSLLGVLAAGSWLTYGVLLLDPAQLVGNVPGLLGAVLTAALVYRRTGLRQAHGQVLTAAWALALAGVWFLAGVQGVGIAATVVSLVKLAPQLQVVLRGGSLAALSPGTYLLATVAAVLWTVYGLALGQGSVIVCSAISAVLSAFVLSRRCPPRRVVLALDAGRWGAPGRVLVRPVLALAA